MSLDTLLESLTEKEGRSAGRLPWERQYGEGRKPFAYFSDYRDMGVSRTIRKVAQGRNKALSWLALCSSRWSWVERAESWDAYQDRESRIAEIASIREMNERQVGLAKLLQAKLLVALRGMDADKLTPAAIAQWLEVSVKVERLASGQATERTAGVAEETPEDREFLRRVLGDPKAMDLVDQLLDGPSEPDAK